MYEYIPGQRWISEAEMSLGLGTIVSVEQRTISIQFPGCEQIRNYAKQSAPLTRVVFSAGDLISDIDGNELQVESVVDLDGLLSYHCRDRHNQPVIVDESSLNHAIQLYKPGQRLLNGLVDKSSWFELRYLSLFHSHRLSHFDLYGLTGGRTSLIPHQLFIAHEVARRYAPRVLLADEVGLGKTIEAGLIINQQLVTEQVQRILIVVPESLVHQWLVEMLRRFNLMFSLFDESRCRAIEESAFETTSHNNNPFHSEQLVICSLGFLTQDPMRQAQVSKGDWDLLVVDEAHHLGWSEQVVSDGYRLVEALARITPGVLLLTATPEQLGKDGHFARLRLLDPDRFSDYQSFLKQEQGYQNIAHSIENLLSKRPLDSESRSTIEQTLGEGDNQKLLSSLMNAAADSQQQEQARQRLIEHLLDRHGTGRILFRNTRDAIHGFPERRLHQYPLALPDAYSDFKQSLCPEKTYTESGQAGWTQFDPRYQWLVNKLKQQPADKILVIAAHADTAIAIAHQLKTGDGIKASVFHERMSIVERDRAAAYFADNNEGCQVLICSEIGSEGRNFQFAHHLLLFDLPEHPDLLEQRIGRLDRIGQSDNIQIHVPYFKHSAQQILFEWYQFGLDAFEHTRPEAGMIHLQLQHKLEQAMQISSTSAPVHTELLTQCQDLYRQLHKQFQQGRDRLLEYNSCRPHLARKLQQQAQQADEEYEVDAFIDYVSDCFGFDFEELSPQHYRIRPGLHMVSSFPGLPDEGLIVTYDRNTALENEDIHYLSWEHPLLINAMDMVQTSEMGNSALTAVNYGGFKPGSLLLECIYLLESTAKRNLPTQRYLPRTMIRLLVDEQGRDHSKQLEHSVIKQHEIIVDQNTAQKIIQAQQQQIKQLITISEQLALKTAPEILADARSRSQQILQTEIDRLKALKRINPNVRNEEINFFKSQLEETTHLLDNAKVRLDAIRVIIET